MTSSVSSQLYPPTRLLLQLEAFRELPLPSSRPRDSCPWCRLSTVRILTFSFLCCPHLLFCLTLALSWKHPVLTLHPQWWADVPPLFVGSEKAQENNRPQVMACPALSYKIARIDINHRSTCPFSILKMLATALQTLPTAAEEARPRGQFLFVRDFVSLLWLPVDSFLVYPVLFQHSFINSEVNSLREKYELFCSLHTNSTDGDI